MIVGHKSTIVVNSEEGSVPSEIPEVLHASKVDGSRVGKGASTSFISEEVKKEPKETSSGTPGDVLVIAATEEPSSGTERLAPASIDGKNHKTSFEVKDHKCTGEGDKGSNIGGTGSALFALPVDKVRTEKAEECTTCFIAEGSVVEGTDHKGPTPPGSTNAKGELTATEHNACTGDLEMESATSCTKSDPAESSEGAVIGNSNEKASETDFCLVARATSALGGHLEYHDKGPVTSGAEETENSTAPYVGIVSKDG